MREIKFRQRIKGKHGTKDRWHYWGYLDGDKPLADYTMPMGKVEWDERISYQYIGMKDTINKKEMYEGDIVKIYTFISEEEPELNDFTIHKIEYKIAEDFPGFDLEPFLDCECNGLSWAMCAVECEGIEVIGNVTENPEILKNMKMEAKED